MAMVNPYNYKKPIGVRLNSVPQNDIKIKPSSTYGNSTTDYLEQKIMSAKPEELTLMLYDGIVKFIGQAKLFNDQNNFEKSNYANLKAQAIVDELRMTLNMDYEVSEGLDSIYSFMFQRLIDANLHKDNKYLDEVLELAIDLRDTWKEAMKL